MSTSSASIDNSSAGVNSESILQLSLPIVGSDLLDDSNDKITDIINNAETIGISTPIDNAMSIEDRYLSTVVEAINTLIEEKALKLNNNSINNFQARYQEDYSSLFIDIKKKILLIVSDDIFVKDFSEFRKFFNDFKTNELALYNRISEFQNILDSVRSKEYIIEVLKEKSDILDKDLQRLSLDVEIKNLTLTECTEKVKNQTENIIISKDDKETLGFFRTFSFFLYFGNLIYNLFTNSKIAKKDKILQLNEQARESLSSSVKVKSSLKSSEVRRGLSKNDDSKLTLKERIRASLK